MSESSAGMETLVIQAPLSLTKIKSETSTQPEHQFKKLISYLNTRGDIAEISTPSGG